MANEISISTSLKVANGHFVQDWKKAFRADQSGIGAGPGVVDVTSTEAAVDFGDVNSPGWTWIVNLSENEGVFLGFEASFASGIYIPAGQTAGPFRLIGSSSVYVRTGAGAASLWFVSLEA